MGPPDSNALALDRRGIRRADSLSGTGYRVGPLWCRRITKGTERPVVGSRWLVPGGGCVTSRGSRCRNRALCAGL